MDLFQVLIAESKSALSSDCRSHGRLITARSVCGNTDNLGPFELPFFLGESETPRVIISQLRLIAPAALDSSSLPALGQETMHGGPEDQKPIVEAPHVE